MSTGAVSSIYSPRERDDAVLPDPRGGALSGLVVADDFAPALEANYKPFWYKAYPGETYYVAVPRT